MFLKIFVSRILLNCFILLIFCEYECGYVYKIRFWFVLGVFLKIFDGYYLRVFDNLGFI